MEQANVSPSSSPKRKLGDAVHAVIVVLHHSPTGEIAGVNGQNSEGMCQGGKPGTGKLYTDVCLCWPWGYSSVLSIIIIIIIYVTSYSIAGGEIGTAADPGEGGG